jgi:RNA recognition motif-containing protein
MVVTGQPSLQLRVFVGGFGGLATEVELREAFGDVGVQLRRIEVVMCAATGCSRGFAFVVVSRLDAAETRMEVDEVDILDRMRAAVVRGRPLTVHPVPNAVHARAGR